MRRPGLRPRPAACEPAAQDALQVRDELRIAQRTAGALPRTQGRLRRGVFMRGEEFHEVTDALGKRADRDQAVVLAGQVGAGAGPGPVLRPRDRLR